VIGRYLFLPLAVLAIWIVGCGSVNDAGEPGATDSTRSAATRQISGNWRGWLHEAGLAPFEIAVNIGASGTGDVAYTGIDCGGEWTLNAVRTSGPPHYLYVFTEQIAQGASRICKGTGRVLLSPIQRQIPNEPAYQRMSYQFSGGGVTSRGFIHRTDAGHMRAIYKRAGVPAP
jgi:uncharacterized protein YceK